MNSNLKELINILAEHGHIGVKDNSRLHIAALALVPLVTIEPDWCKEIGECQHVKLKTTFRPLGQCFSSGL